MKRVRFTEEQIIAVLCEQEAGAKRADLAGSSWLPVQIIQKEQRSEDDKNKQEKQQQRLENEDGGVAAQDYIGIEPGKFSIDTGFKQRLLSECRPAGKGVDGMTQLEKTPEL